MLCKIHKSKKGLQISWMHVFSEGHTKTHEMFKLRKCGWSKNLCVGDFHLALKWLWPIVKWLSWLVNHWGWGHSGSLTLMWPCLWGGQGSACVPKSYRAEHSWGLHQGTSEQSTSSSWTCDSEGTIHLSPLDSTFWTLCGSVSAGGDLQLAPEWN